MTILVTGAAGFIGMHVARALARRGQAVLGIDNLNDYYDVALKQARLAELSELADFRFAKIDLGDVGAMAGLDKEGLTGIVHLAAQAGVRYSLKNPRAYIDANIIGQLNVLELSRRLGGDLSHLVYASSSSVYGGNEKLPFAVEDRVDHPISIYAATKKADELMGHAFSHIYRLPMTGLRFFTVYGPWGRPDMAAYIFAAKIMAGEPIEVFNDGNMRRDFTFIDDIVAGVVAAFDRPPGPPGGDKAVADAGPAPHRIYNLGNNRPTDLMDFISLLEEKLGAKAQIAFKPLQPGDVPETFADIAGARTDLGFAPKTGIEEGLDRFVAWFKSYHGH
ncbi:MAG: NAD-dependent epimerase/dehydratase family protein [Alphaproteobacteria bacterium]|nr:NAD-dependent epimerase/dehydratase family protein [Alphaproteobacteria bacterium]